MRAHVGVGALLAVELENCEKYPIVVPRLASTVPPGLAPPEHQLEERRLARAVLAIGPMGRPAAA